MDMQTDFPFGIDAWWKTPARLQFEMLGLMVRRTQAYLDLPGQFARCTTADEFAAEQARFWEVAQREYLHRFESVMSAVPLAPIVDAGAAGPIARSRDYLTVLDGPATTTAQAATSTASAVAVAGKTGGQALRRSA